jgi:hypothetical protein
MKSLFEKNTSLYRKTAFLSEGIPSGRVIDISPLWNVCPTPSLAEIRYVLDSYLIPGYVALEWQTQMGIPILGIEEEDLYQLSARIWVSIQNTVTITAEEKSTFPRISW